MKKFKGDVSKWQEFWDSFESSIHSNDCLSDVDKFNYLQYNLSLVVYRFSRVVFGVNSSPFLLNATLRHHISKFAVHDKHFSDILLRSFYVDDLATGEASTEAAYLLYTKAKERMNEGV